MKVNTIAITILEPEQEGNLLTNGDGYSYKVYLGENDSIDNWYEITPEIAKEKFEDFICT